jgi:hypothetical protein
MSTENKMEISPSAQTAPDEVNPQQNALNLSV